MSKKHLSSDDVEIMIPLGKDYVFKLLAKYFTSLMLAIFHAALFPPANLVIYSESLTFVI